MGDKVWVVVHRTCDGTLDAEVFENRADAESFKLESAETSDLACTPENVRLVETSIRRREALASDDAAWGIPMLDIDSEYIEGLLEEISPQAGVEAIVAEHMLKEKREKIEKEARARVRDLLCDELRCGLKEMGD